MNWSTFQDFIHLFGRLLVGTQDPAIYIYQNLPAPGDEADILPGCSRGLGSKSTMTYAYSNEQKKEPENKKKQADSYRVGINTYEIP